MLGLYNNVYDIYHSWYIYGFGGKMNNRRSASHTSRSARCVIIMSPMIGSLLVGVNMNGKMTCSLSWDLLHANP